ncbi:TPA: CRISPR-associated endoribonuclease Cas6 [Streptococcus suis]
MQLTIRLECQRQQGLPLSYNYLVQAAIYNLLREDSDLSHRLHDVGYQLENRKFKLFSFSSLRGEHTIQEKVIYFHNFVELEIRSIDSEIIQTLARSLLNKETLKIGEIDFYINDFTISRKELKGDSYRIRMLSPIVLHRTIDKKTIYLSPMDRDFQKQLNHNLSKKYQAYYGKEMEGKIELLPIYFKDRNKVVTKYKEFYITGWRGDYQLHGPSYLLNFLYQVGLGEKNSMGFGLFEFQNKEV